MATRKLHRGDVISLVPMVKDCWHNLCNHDTVLGHLESLLALVLAPVVIPVLKLWLPQKPER